MCSHKEIIVNNSETVLHLIFKFVGSLFDIFVESYPRLILEVDVISNFCTTYFVLLWFFCLFLGCSCPMGGLLMRATFLLFHI